jgi:flagellar hook-associated protein 3 FlgL
MRVAFSQTYEKMNLNINRKKEDLDRYANMISSGERMRKPADDPLGWAQALGFRQGIRELDALAKNVDFASSWTKATETALADVATLVSNAISIGNSSLNTQDPGMRQALTQELNYTIQAAVSSANTQQGEQYLFGGNLYTTPPFQMTVVSGDVTAITYQGGPAYDLEVRTGKGSMETVNINGQVAFDTAGTDVLQQLLTLKNAVQAGDTATVRAQVAALQNSSQNLIRLTAQTQSLQAGLERKSGLLSSLKSSQQDQLSDVANADSATAIIHYQQTQTIYEAALRVASTLSNLNLASFL